MNWERARDYPCRAPRPRIPTRRPAQPPRRPRPCRPKRPQACLETPNRRPRRPNRAPSSWWGWRPDQESNLDLPLRRRPFYPLNYRGFRSRRRAYLTRAELARSSTSRRRPLEPRQRRARSRFQSLTATRARAARCPTDPNPTLARPLPWSLRALHTSRSIRERRRPFNPLGDKHSRGLQAIPMTCQACQRTAQRQARPRSAAFSDPLA